MRRITRAHLEAKAAYLNKLTGSPAEMWTSADTVNRTMNPGHFYISSGYGGNKLARISNATGGESCPFSTGYLPARELAGLIDAFCRGYEMAQREREA